MQLAKLVEGYTEAVVRDDVDVTGLNLDSRKITSGDVFVALKGVAENGATYLAQAIKNGAVAALVEEGLSGSYPIPVIHVPNLREKIGVIAARFYGFPARDMRMIGVTGTNGKTSVTHFIAEALSILHERCGLIGTLGAGYFGELKDTGLTTPDAVTLQKQLLSSKDQGAAAIAMEVSSHSIHQSRVNGIEFEFGIFTNLTQDHLDYHSDMASYAAVKFRFIAGCSVSHAIINVDDEYGAYFASDLGSQKSVFAYGTRVPANLLHEMPMTLASDIKLSLSGIEAKVTSPWGEGVLRSQLLGHFNLSNLLAALNALCLYGISLNDALAALSQVHPVPGRMQTLGGESKPVVVVDYAHTPDALLKVLEALRQETKGKLICVFGCGGDRDPDKRPLMGEIAEKLADLAIITSDNPRTEDPDLIIQQILRGFKAQNRAVCITDRSKAIEKGIQSARVGDCVLIAGKGAERYQRIGNVKTPFDDVSEAMRYLV